MPLLFASDDDRDLVRAERDVGAAFSDLDLDLRSLAAVSNIFRAATAVRNHMENGVLAQHELSWSAFTDAVRAARVGRHGRPLARRRGRGHRGDVDRCDEDAGGSRAAATQGRSRRRPTNPRVADAARAAASWVM